LTAGLLAAPCVAAAQSDRGFYGGVAIGAADLGWDSGGVGTGFKSVSDPPWLRASDSAELTDRTWKLFSGYHFNRYLAIEAAWTDPDETSEMQSGSQQSFATTSRPETEGLSFGAVGVVPVAKSFDVFARATVSGWGVAGLSALDPNGEFAEEDEGSPGAMLGIGAEYGLSERLSIRTEWQRFNDGLDSDRDFLSIGISSRF
jgi:hypothetical protein